MIETGSLEIAGETFTTVQVALPKTNLLVITNDIGYIMCAALDVDVLNEKLADRHVIAGRASGVRTIDQLLHAPLEKVTEAAREKFGWETGMIGEEALKRLI
ncbi:DUF1805 domain-containing protein [Virgibacillus sp. 179-BFC.A HS]|uniref:DUF1805 domain-containing protein n=1 Tax=Tigheibacillus jepli TaxID=3035914 RepID=A0ABU5CFZ1_9BACI|nr:DUF1805 domain-containing protein [Virgibacillus sp. 179-BFC.A HS]MDY0405225.1 DUF1805 domain-containing protein [Virgibacillus sp. 179-BFC.A HS]